MAPSSKALLVFALLLAAASLFATAEETQETKDAYHGGGGHYPGHGGGGYPGHGGGGYPGHGGGGYPGHGHGGGGCRWGCCGRGYYRGCRCCASADEVPEPMYRPEGQVHN
uniref:Glycine-rich protein n=1 Tax=Oryza punctata TaxID=4537 RepID=A0A0E0K1P4_ORYPU